MLCEIMKETGALREKHKTEELGEYENLMCKPPIGKLRQKRSNDQIIYPML